MRVVFAEELCVRRAEDALTLPTRNWNARPPSNDTPRKSSRIAIVRRTLVCRCAQVCAERGELSLQRVQDSGSPWRRPADSHSRAHLPKAVPAAPEEQMRVAPRGSRCYGISTILTNRSTATRHGVQDRAS